MQKLHTVNADTLLYEPLEKPSFVVDGLIPTGLTLFCGAQKIGKSWLMLKLCLCVSQGIPLWDMPTQEGDVLYLCLEDTFCRIQDRLFRLTDEASGRLHFAVATLIPRCVSSRRAMCFTSVWRTRSAVSRTGYSI